MSIDRTVGGTFYTAFTTRAFGTGIPTVLAGSPVISIYENDSITQITAGITLTVSLDSVVGFNMVKIVATGGNGFETGKDYKVVITTGTVGGVSVAGEIVEQFSLGLSAAAVDLANGTDGLGAIKGDTAAILVDTGTTLDNKINDLQGVTFSSATDSNEAIRNRGDAEWTTGAGGTPPSLLQATTIATLASQVSFTLTAGSADDDAYNDMIVVVTDVSTSTQKAVGRISDYTGSTKTVTLEADPGVFTMAVTDNIDIIAVTNHTTTVDVATAVTDQVTADMTAVNGVTLGTGAVPELGIVDSGTAQSATATTLVLRAAAAFADDELIGAVIVITGGSAGVGQSKVITDSVLSSDTVTVDTWKTTPTGTIKYVIFAAPQASSALPVPSNVTEWLGTAAATPTVAGVPEVDATHLAGSATAAVNLKFSADTIVRAAAITGTLSTTQMTTDLTEVTDDHYNGRIIIWTSGVLKNQGTDITDYTGATKLLTFTATTEAPSNTDTFVIV